MPRLPKRPRDMMQLAKFIGEKAESETQGDKDKATPLPDAAAVKRGEARAARLPAAKRSEIAKGAAKARWGKKE